jgi:hypothetical protein
MPKLNVIGMIVLSLALAAGATTLALRTGAPRSDPQVDRLIRRLGDTDPDLRREAERELKGLGRAAEPALKKAAEGPDPALAERAKSILGIGKPEPPPIAIPPEPATVRLTLQLTAAPRTADEPVMYFLRLHNRTKRAVAIARHLTDGGPDVTSFGSFERLDAEGRLVTLGKIAPGEGDVEIVMVAPGESLDLFPAAGVLRVGAKGTYRLRFVYDASEGSAYRASVAVKHLEASALPAERFESNDVTVTVN